MKRLIGLLLSASLAACGGGGGNGGFTSPPPPVTDNVVAVSVDGGVAGQNINTLFVSVTFCMPGSTTNCKTVDHIQVDTGSYGLRVLAEAMPLALPLQSASGGGTLVECTGFVDGYSWGPIVLSDVSVGSKTAASVPIQVIGDARYPNVPQDCANSAPVEEDTVATFGANGILGVGPFLQDCGSGCADNVVSPAYYGCTSAAANTCTATAVPVDQQVQSVVAKFSADNNGVIIQLPAVSGNNAASLTGSLIFGVNTESNNTLSGATVLTLDGFGDFIAQFNGQTLNDSFIDSGTNGTYFNDINLPSCTQTGLTDFYCPATQQNLMVTLQGQNGVTSTQNFTVANAFTVFSNAAATDFPTIGGTYPGTTSSFDFGLPFFYGRNVAVLLEGESTSLGNGPLIAF
jgi:uncharacterized protein DUF3443